MISAHLYDSLLSEVSDDMWTLVAILFSGFSFCPRCGIDFKDEDYEVCPHCGHPLE